jgi:F-type H+-transporting ATPase subunit delta
MPSEFDISQSAASIYAESLLSLATEAGQADVVGQELAELRALWNKDASFAAMMSSAAIDEDARRESIKKIFGNRVSKLVLNLMLVLNDRMRSMVFPAVCDTYRRKLALQLGQAEARVTSAVPLDDAQRKDILSKLKTLSGREPVLVEKVDPEILGGVSIQVGDRVYDLSVRRRLRDLRAMLAQSAEKHMLHNSSKFVTQG